uniref:Kelch-like family, member 42 n=1 Tax=Sinocyclocheilus rhinocerous TaxID=307959 RepID=A0A673IKI8_9TELE
MTSPEQIIEIVMDDKTYNVSKSKLIEKSDYFRALYSGGLGAAAGIERAGVVPNSLVLEFINTSKVQVANETLEDLIETASFLQVTSILKRLLSEIKQENCVELFKHSEVYGMHDLRNACLKFMSCYYLSSHAAQATSTRGCIIWQGCRIRHNTGVQDVDMRMKGTATLVAIGDFTGTCLDLANQDEPWSMLRYDELLEQRWKPLANSLPPDMINVRGYGSAVLDNYLFIDGGYRMTSQEISVAHCYNPCKNEWNHVAPLNQKRSNFKLLAVSGKLYAVGGHCLSAVECYSPEQDWWTCVVSLPDPLAEFSACECHGMIYVMGGFTSRDRNTNVLRYCPASDTRSVFCSCSAHVRRQQMLSVEDTIYLVGGYTHELEPDMLTVQSYNVQTGEWLQLKENTSKSGLNLTCTLHNDGIYIMSRYVSLPTSLEHRVFLKYNIFSDAWEAFRRFPALGQNMLLCSLYLPNVL